MKHLILLLSLFLLSFSLFGQTPVGSEKQLFIKEYLENFVITHNKKAEKKGGISVEFTDEFEPLPSELEKSLQMKFPNHKFVIAKMLKFHNAPRPVNLIIGTKLNSNKVISYAWDLAFDGVSDSFRNVLTLSPVKSKEHALSKVQTLSELLVFSGNGRVGKIEMNKGIISAELFFEYAGEKEPYRILKVKTDKNFRFGRIALINPVDNKKGSKVE